MHGNRRGRNWRRSSSTVPRKLEVPPGSKFGKLTVIEETTGKSAGRYFLLECECGNKRTARLCYLNHKQIESCGYCNDPDLLTAAGRAARLVEMRHVQAGDWSSALQLDWAPELRKLQSA